MSEYFAKPVTVTDERVREALEKQQRQRALREELDSQRAQQREERLRAGLPAATNEPMTRAQRHRLRVAEEQLELQRQQSQVAQSPSYHLGGAPQSIYHVAPPGSGVGVPSTPSIAPSVPWNGTFGAQARNPVALPQLPPNRSMTGALPAVRGTPRGIPPTQQEESIYQWGAPDAYGRSPTQISPRFPTPPQAPPSFAYQRAQAVIPKAVTLDEVRPQYDGTLTTAPPYNASQAELAAWLSDATERIRKARAPVYDETQHPPQSRQQHQHRGPATRGANIEYDDESPAQKQPAQRSAPTPKSTTRDTKVKAVEVKRVAKLEATLAGQAAEVARLQEKQKEWENQVAQLKGELKNARQKERELAKAVNSKAPKEKRAETAPKPQQPTATRGSSKARPITAGPELQPEEQRNAHPQVQEDLRQSYRSRKGLPLAPLVDQRDSTESSPKKSKKPIKQEAFRPLEQPVDFGKAAPLTFDQLLAFTESKLLSHRQVQQLWELFSGANSRQSKAQSSFAPDDEFAAPLETFETYEDLVGDDEDDDY